MIPFVELRMFTITEQIVTIQPNEANTGLVLVTEEFMDKSSSTRLYLTFDEAKELMLSLDIMINKIKK